MERFGSYNHPFPHRTLPSALSIHSPVYNIYICSFSLIVASVAGQPDLDIPLSFFTQFAWLPREEVTLPMPYGTSSFLYLSPFFPKLGGVLVCRSGSHKCLRAACCKLYIMLLYMRSAWRTPGGEFQFLWMVCKWGNFYHHQLGRLVQRRPAAPCEHEPK